MRKHLIVHFSTNEDIIEFEKIIGFNITSKDFTFHRSRKCKGFDLPREYALEKRFFKKERDISWELSHWWGLPEYSAEALDNKSITIRFTSQEDRYYFGDLIGQKLTDKTDSIWFPPVPNLTEKNWYTGGPGNQFPIYIPSKGRGHLCITMGVLDQMGADYRVIIEEQEYRSYRRNIKKDRLLILPDRYKEEYDTCDDIEHANCSGPARNFAWDHSLERGYPWHWTMDDNIDMFLRFTKNQYFRMYTPTFFGVMEDFVLRYKKVAMAGPNYYMFVARKDKLAPFVPNTRLFSCNLINGNSPYRWRGRYNEDADLSIRMLKDGWSTIQFNSFLQRKLTTQTLAGGNTDLVYKDGTKDKSEMLKRLHPDCVSLSYKFNRHHHHIHYERLPDTPLTLKKGIKVKKGIDEYGLEYHNFEGDTK